MDERNATKSVAETPAPVTKSASKPTVANTPAASATKLPQTGEKSAKSGILAGILSLLGSLSLFAISFKKRKQEN